MDKSKARNVDYKAPASANKESFLNWHEMTDNTINYSSSLFA